MSTRRPPPERGSRGRSSKHEDQDVQSEALEKIREVWGKLTTTDSPMSSQILKWTYLALPVGVVACGVVAGWVFALGLVVFLLVILVVLLVLG